MAVTKRTWFTLLGVVATALTIFGVVFAATDSNSTSSSATAKDPLAMNGYPPKTADFAFSASSGSSYSVHANVEVNFITNKIEANFVVPLVTSGVQVDVRLIGDKAYMSSPNFASVLGEPWIEFSDSLPALYNFSLELVRPDISLITGFGSETVTKNGYFVTHSFHRNDVAVRTLDSSTGTLPKVGRLTFSITTGKQGEVTQGSLRIATKTNQTTLSATVLSYNQPTHIVAPPANEVLIKDPAFLQRLIDSASLSILFPRISPT